MSHRIWPRLCLLGAKYFDSLSIAMKLYCCQCIDYNIHPHLCLFEPSCQPYWHLTIYFKVSLTVLQFLTSQVWTSIWTIQPPLDWRQRITQYGTLTSLESPFARILRLKNETFLEETLAPPAGYKQVQGCISRSKPAVGKAVERYEWYQVDPWCQGDPPQTILT